MAYHQIEKILEPGGVVKLGSVWTTYVFEPDGRVDEIWCCCPLIP